MRDSIVAEAVGGSALLNPAAEAKNLAITLDKPIVFGKRAFKILRR